jgi:hypothetical protein
MGTLFDDLDPDGPIHWGRNRNAPGQQDWHLVGPRMPRIAPVSPTYLSPCGAILYGDSMEMRRKAPAQGGCGFCARFLEGRVAAKRDGYWPEH